MAIAALTMGGCVTLFPPPDPAGRRHLEPVIVQPLAAGVAHERFFAVGDFGTGGTGQRMVAEVMADRARRDGLDFVLGLGDNFYPSGVGSVADPQWCEKFEEVYDDPALSVPWYAALGNHDHLGNVQAQIDYGAASDKWRMPARDYTFTRVLDDGTTAAFFVIDTTPVHKETAAGDETVRRLDEALAESDARWKIVAGHHPLYSHGTHGRDERMIETLEPLFVSHGVDVYFAGHDHTLEMLKPVGGVYHVVAGGGGGTDNPYGIAWTDEADYAATGGGFAACRISRDELVIEFVRMDGKTQFAQVIRKYGR